MRAIRTLHAVAVAALCMSALPARDAAAQHIHIKTVPIPTGEQFAIYPSRNMGMGAVHVATDDPQLDPFLNPARGARVERFTLYALPTFYGEAADWVGGRTLPVAFVVPGMRLFGGGVFALQQIADRGTRVFWPGPASSDFSDNSSSNTYVQGTLGMRVGSRTALGVSAFHADLGAVDGVRLLYGNSSAVAQSGELAEFRAGATHEFDGGRVLDIVALNSRLDMRHDVFYTDVVWQWPEPPLFTQRTEHNRDRTITWAAQARYTQPLEHGARLGITLAGNTKAHPEIPNYDLVNIPRDPGNSTMFNIGVGVSSQTGPALFGVDLIYEPGRSHTWAYADSVTTTPGGTLQPGDKTIDNRFRFSNWMLGMGLQREQQRFDFQLGLRLRQIRYTLDQHNFLTDLQRNTRESWLEWSPSWGAVVKFPEFDLRYTGRFTARGWPTFGGMVVMPDAGVPGIDFVVGATGPVWLPEYRVTTHRLTLSVPIGL
jgi:hypothetical protein